MVPSESPEDVTKTKHNDNLPQSPLSFGVESYPKTCKMEGGRMESFYEHSDEAEVLRGRIKELSRIRQGFAAHLGSSLYDATKNDEALRWGRESLYDGIALCDTERDRLLQRIESLSNDTSNEASTMQEATFEPDTVFTAPVDSVDDQPAMSDEVVILPNDPVADVNTWDTEDEIVAHEDAIEPQREEPDKFDDASQIVPDYISPIVIEPIPAPEPIREEAISKPEPVRQGAQDALRCPACGAIGDPGNKFCMMCGTRLVPVPEEVSPSPAPSVCPECGSPVDPSYKFCMTCGHKL